jgi:hypothetical protein
VGGTRGGLGDVWPDGFEYVDGHDGFESKRGLAEFSWIDLVERLSEN